MTRRFLFLNSIHAGKHGAAFFALDRMVRCLNVMAHRTHLVTVDWFVTPDVAGGSVRDVDKPTPIIVTPLHHRRNQPAYTRLSNGAMPADSLCNVLDRKRAMPVEQ